MRALVLAAALTLCASPAFAQSAQNASDASTATSQAAAALTESGVKTAVGVSATPIGSAGQTSVAVGVTSAVVGSAAVAGAADSMDFANAPLSVSDDVVLSPPPQDAPNVPYDAQQKNRQP